MIECIHFFPCLKLCHLRFFWHWEYGPKASGLLESFSELGQCELCGVSRPQFWVKQILWYIMVCLVSCSPKNIVKTISPSGLCLVWNKHYLRHSQGYLTAGMLHAGEGYPCLTIKAWNGRLLVIFLDRCLRAYLQSKRDAGEPHALKWSLLQLLLVQFALGSMLWRGQGATWHRARPVGFTGMDSVFWRATAGWQSNQRFLEHTVGNTFQSCMCFYTSTKICCSQSSTAGTHIVLKTRTMLAS